MLKKKKEKKNIITVNMHWYFVNICDSCTMVKQLQTQDVIADKVWHLTQYLLLYLYCKEG